MSRELGLVRSRVLLALHYSLRLLIILTPLLLVWNHFGMNRTFEINAKSGHQFSVYDDRRLGGKSISTLKNTGDSMVMDCQLQGPFEWPFCHFSIQLAELQNSVDLSGFESMTFNLIYTGPGTHNVRFFMRNFEDEIASRVDWQTLKPNGVEFEVPESGEVQVPMKIVQVAAWWLTQRKIPPINSGMRIDRVPYVELSTGTNAALGSHQIELKSIKFHGKWISQAHLLMWLVGAWLIFGLDRVVMELLAFRTKLLTTKSRVADLISALRTKKEQLNNAMETPPAADIFATGAPIETTTQTDIATEEINPPMTPEPADDDHSLASQESDDAQLQEINTAPHLARPVFLRWITATVGTSLRLIAVDDILYFQSDQKYTRVVLAESEVLIKKTLKELLAELDPEQFWKIHRSIVVNALEVASIEPDLGGQLAVKLKTRRERLPVSEGFVRRIRQL